MIMNAIAVCIIGTIILGIHQIYLLSVDQKLTVFLIHLFICLLGYGILIIGNIIMIHEERERRRREELMSIVTQASLYNFIRQEYDIINNIYIKNVQERTDIETDILNIYINKRNLINVI